LIVGSVSKQVTCEKKVILTVDIWFVLDKTMASLFVRYTKLATKMSLIPVSGKDWVIYQVDWNVAFIKLTPLKLTLNNEAFNAYTKYVQGRITVRY